MALLLLGVAVLPPIDAAEVPQRTGLPVAVTRLASQLQRIAEVAGRLREPPKQARRLTEQSQRLRLADHVPEILIDRESGAV
jgi:hypothetical protein